MPRHSRALQICEGRFDKKPEWLRVRYRTGENYGKIKGILRHHNVYTVCEEANCPNVAECWNAGTATFMVMGDTCTRGCRFCMVKSGNPRGTLDVFEPLEVARSIADLGLRYVVITSVDRDDLPDGGASHFAATIRAIKQHDPSVIVEVLIPDFRGNIDHVRTIVEAGPQIMAHNIETTEPLTARVRDPRATYRQSLKVLRSIKDLKPTIYSKSSIMLGLGETESDLVGTMRDLRDAEVDILTLGQYLSPTKGHIAVSEYVRPSRFQYYKQAAEELGFLCVAAGPFVRSSYRAAELFLETLSLKRPSAVNRIFSGLS
jgi:lipoic acid synthetase